MSITEFRANDIGLNRNTCPRCGVALPGGAAFCTVCGERLDNRKSLTTLSGGEEDIATRYRITSLVRRRPFINLYFALDFQQTTNQGQARMVAIRDIDLTSLADAELVKALEIAQQEYDLLRRGDIPLVMPAIDLRFFQGHLFLVSGHPNLSPVASGSPDEAGSNGDARLNTLQDYLQSGYGLPAEQRALQWAKQLCLAVDGLHQRQIVLGDLDPFAILYAGEMGEPAAAYLSPLISWLHPALRALLPSSTTTSLSYFVAPQAMQGDADARSDVYSLGAILYLLLTGMPPGESTQRNRSRQNVLRAPHDIHGRTSLHASECAMQALALQPAERFESAAAFASALGDPHYRRPPSTIAEQEPSAEQGGEVETVRILPLSHRDAERWRAAHHRTIQDQVQQPDQASVQQATAHPARPPIPPRPVTPRPPLLSETASAESEVGGPRGVPPAPPSPGGVPETPPVGSRATLPGESLQEGRDDGRAEQAAQRSRSHKFGLGQRIAAMLPGISSKSRREQRAAAPQSQGSWIDQLKQVLLGKQQQAILAAAIIETPLRVLPDQMYTLRIHIIGRDEPDTAARKRADGQELSLSRLVHGDTVLIEVRSVLQQSYAYIIQRASVTVPAEGYVAEVTIPMQPLSSTPTGRRDRLHIFFMNEHRQHLYEKPFAVEIFVSHHVKRGNEGHHVLTIPW